MAAATDFRSRPPLFFVPIPRTGTQDRCRVGGWRQGVTLPYKGVGINFFRNGRSDNGVTLLKGRESTAEGNEPMNDQALVDAVREGDPSAQRALIERYQGVVYTLCYRMMGHRHDAEDVAQDTFIRALRGIGGFDRDRPIRPWLLGIAANRCRTALVRRSRRPATSDVVDGVVDPTPPPPADPEGLVRELERALERLRPEYRAVFSLYHEQELPYEDIARVLDRPVGTVKTWLHRARAELADHLSRRGVQC